MENGYSAKIVEASHEFSAKERIALKDIRNATSLDVAVEPGAPMVITPDKYAVVEIHNDKAKGDKDYTKYVIIDKDGNKFYTGSASFYRSFKEIWDEMKQEAADEEFDIECYKTESKNFPGKYFISCSIV